MADLWMFLSFSSREAQASHPQVLPFESQWSREGATSRLSVLSEGLVLGSRVPTFKTCNPLR